MRPRTGRMKTIIWRTGVRQTLLKTVVLNETPRWAYENYHLENMCSPNHIRNCCFGIRPRAGIIKTVIWRTCVRETILETVPIE